MSYNLVGTEVKNFRFAWHHFSPSSFYFKWYFGYKCKNKTPKWIIDYENLKARGIKQEPPPQGKEATWNGHEWIAQASLNNPKSKVENLGSSLIVTPPIKRKKPSYFSEAKTIEANDWNSLMQCASTENVSKNATNRILRSYSEIIIEKNEAKEELKAKQMTIDKLSEELA